MHCPDEQTLIAFVDDELSPSQAGEVERHVAGCPACAETVQDHRRLNALGRSALRRIPVTPARRPAPAVRSRHRFGWVAAGIAATAAAVVLTVVATRWRPTRPSTSGDDVAGLMPPTATRPNVAQAASALLLDDEFARWSAKLRRGQIPRIPLEQVADHVPAPMLPVLGADAQPRS